MTAHTAAVVGGGIGGLPTALALIEKGWQVTVFERAAEFTEAGAGLSVWPNGMRALDELGVGARVRDLGIPDLEAGIRDRSGRWLSRTDTAELARRYGPLLMIHRARLLDILRRALPPQALRAGTGIEQVRDHGTHVEIVHDSGRESADLVVGADGLNSTVRQSIWPQAPAPRYAGYTAWRLVIDPGEPLTTGGESWGHGSRVGLAPMADGRVYLFAVANTAAAQHSPDGELAELRRRFTGWHAPIPHLLDRAAADSVLRHDIYELPPLTSYATGRVALVGDAAHAMTPNLGQGANQALEDAVTLAAALDDQATVAAALATYDRLRRPRTQAIARRSRLVGAVAQWQWAPLTTLRDRLLGAAPARSMLDALGPVLTWQPPSPHTHE